MDEPARRRRAPIDRLPTRRAHACVAFREPSEEARTVDGEYEPISVVGSTVYELARAGWIVMAKVEPLPFEPRD